MATAPEIRVVVGSDSREKWRSRVPVGFEAVREIQSFTLNDVGWGAAERSVITKRIALCIENILGSQGWVKRTEAGRPVVVHMTRTSGMAVANE